MKGLLFLAHRIPYPPNKGDKLRSFNVLKRLAGDYRLYLGTFIDDPYDWRYIGDLNKLCADACYIGLRPSVQRLKSVAGLVTGQPLTLPYYRSARLQSWVDQLFAQRLIDRVVVFSGAMAQFVWKHTGGGTRVVIDFVDVDSDKWRQYSENKAWPMSWLYRREWRTLLRFERAAAERFDASVFVSREEAELFMALVPSAASRITFIDNGVDTEYFSPEASYPNPYAPDQKVLVFTGAMDYWANADAVAWFANDVLPLIRRRAPETCFYIVGARPADNVRRLGALPGVFVTGTVPDVRPYLAHAHAAVAPLRIARGVQNKILEARAMGKPVIVTTDAIAGIAACGGLEHLTADGAEAFAERATELLAADSECARLGRLGRACVVAGYNWTANLERLEGLLEGHDSGADGQSVPRQQQRQ